MKPLKTLGKHGQWTLRQRGDDFMVQNEGRIVLTSRRDGHESDLVRFGMLRTMSASPRVLVGGLGFGFLLRAVLDTIGDGARITVSEPSEAVLAWNRGPLSELHGNSLEDDRVTIKSGDVLAYLATNRGAFDVVLLDLDQGPFDFDVSDETSLYSLGGLTCIRAGLSAGGRVAVAARSTHPGFNKRLRECGFEASVEKVGDRLYFLGDVR